MISDAGMTFNLSAELSETSFMHAVSQAVRSNATGVLEIHDSLGVNRAYFVDGRPQGGKLAQIRHPLGRLAVEAGFISEAELSYALTSQRANQSILGQMLQRLGYVDQAALDALIRRQSQLDFFSLFSTDHGRIEFKPGEAHLANFSPAPLAPVAAIYLGLRYEAGFLHIARMLMPFFATGVRLKDLNQEHAEDLPPAERFAIELLAEPIYPGQLARQLPLSETAVSCLVAALIANDALIRVPAHEVLTVRSRFGSNHRETLESIRTPP